MAVRMNLWSLTLLPGESVPLFVRKDFQITNAALGEELRNESGRSVVKVTHNPIPFNLGDDSDDEFDSDEEMDGEDESEEDDEAEAEAKAAEDDEEDDDEDDEDDEFDDEIQETSVICALTAGKTEQATLNLTFVAGEIVVFEVTGENAVHLLGNYIWQGDDSDSDSDYDSEFDEHDDYSDLELDEDEYDVEEAGNKIVEIPSTAPKAKKAEPKAVAAAPKRKAEEIESPAKEETLSKAQKKKLAKKAKTEAAPAAAPAPAKDSKKRTLPSGLIIEDVKVGTGPAAKPGKRLGMRYVGKLENGKQFDANTGGKPFSFVLGRGEVIAGWDQGLAGMNVGGERRLTIPAKLAYGNQKIPGIPANSTLKFDVKLVEVK